MPRRIGNRGQAGPRSPQRYAQGGVSDQRPDLVGHHHLGRGSGVEILSRQGRHHRHHLLGHGPEPESPNPALIGRSYPSTKIRSVMSRVSCTVCPSTATTVSNPVACASEITYSRSLWLARKAMNPARETSPAPRAKYSARRRNSLGMITRRSVRSARVWMVAPLVVASEAHTPAFDSRASAAAVVRSARKSG